MPRFPDALRDRLESENGNLRETPCWMPQALNSSTPHFRTVFSFVLSGREFYFSIDLFVLTLSNDSIRPWVT